ncbi:helix-turn-helix domain-containing protein [Reyranella sp.]|uniref:helix-turn-helix domain-containing protein n=1 Tax=Reyranella sp. TaxID=1929291 RepID=UPI003D0B1CFC
MRQRRSLLGMSQTALARSVGLTFQQVQKYERGANRMGASRLFEFAAVLGVPVAYFFDEIPATASGASGVTGKPRSDREDHVPPSLDLLSRRETLELVRAYYKIHPAVLRQKLSWLITSLASESPQPRKRLSAKRPRT